MPNAVRVFFKTGGIETGGANALTGLVSGGTMVSESGGTTPLDLPEIGTVYTGYVKMVDENGDDPGFDTVEHVAFDPPAGLEVCETADGTFSDGPLETSIHARGAFQPFFLKPTARVDDGDAYDLSYGALSGGSIVGMTPTAGTRVGQVGTITLTQPSLSSIKADCADVTDADGYLWDISTASDFATYTRSSTSASTQTFTGLTLGTLYYVRCRAFSELGAGAVSATASVTLGTFDFTALDADAFGTVVAGNGTVGVASGELVCDSISAVADAAAAYLKAVVPAASVTYRHKVKAAAQSVSNAATHSISVIDGTPTADTNANVSAKVLVFARVVSTNDGATAGGQFLYYDTNGVLQRWNGSAWGTAAATLLNSAYALGNYVYVDLIVTATTWRLAFRDASLNLLHQCDAVNWSDTRAPAGDKYIAFGDRITESVSYTMKSDSFVVS